VTDSASFTERQLSEVRAPEPPQRPSPLPERRVVVLERDTIHRFSTERILRREDYWVFVTEDAAAAVRVAAVSAVDLVLVDLGLGALEPVPPSERRRGDPGFEGLPPTLAEGYALLRPLHLDPHAHLPIVTLRLGARSEESVPPCRFALAGLLPRQQSASGLVEGLGEVFDDALARAGGDAGSSQDWQPPARARGLRTPTASRPFESTPVPLRSALVVDPDTAARRALASCLVRHDFTVYEAGAGEEALRLAVARRPWLVVTETELTDESGLAFCRRVRAHSLLRRTPVVFLSEQDDCESRHQALKAGADDYLVKPAPSRELLVRLELVLKRFTAELLAGEEPGAGLRGAVELMGAPAVLQICHLSQLTGVLVARRGSQSLRIAFRRGQIVSATGPDHRGAEVVYDFIAWPAGQFEFDRDAVAEGAPMNSDFNALLLEGCRRLDERRRGHSVETPPL
jgi:DNA-binding response OmpR family regulator